MAPSTQHPPSLTSEQLAVLDFVFQQAWRKGVWPKFGDIRRPLKHSGIDLPKALEGLFPKYLKGQGWGSTFLDDEEVLLTLCGINRTEGGRTTVIPLFLEIVEYFVNIEDTYTPANGVMQPTVNQSDIVQYLNRRGRPSNIADGLAKNIGIVILNEASHWMTGSSRGPDGQWSVTLSSDISHYEGIKSIEDYFRRTPQYTPAKLPENNTESTSDGIQPARITWLEPPRKRISFHRSKTTLVRVIEGVAITVIGGLILVVLTKLLI